MAAVLQPDDLEAVAFTTSWEAFREALVGEDKNHRVLLSVGVQSLVADQNLVIRLEITSFADERTSVEARSDVPLASEAVHLEGDEIPAIFQVQGGAYWRKGQGEAGCEAAAGQVR